MQQGAVHSVVFSGFSAEALANRLLDSEAKVLISADAVFRGNKPVLLKQAADEALALCAKTGLKVSHSSSNSNLIILSLFHSIGCYRSSISSINVWVRRSRRT